MSASHHHLWHSPPQSLQNCQQPELSMALLEKSQEEYLASLAKLESFHSIEPDICPKAERVCYPNDLSCCFIIRDIDGGCCHSFIWH